MAGCDFHPKASLRNRARKAQTWPPVFIAPVTLAPPPLADDGR
jgi:hypothetical protein